MSGSVSTKHRLCVVLSGDADWCEASAQRLLETAGRAAADADTLWLSERATPSAARPLRDAAGVLGCELARLVYDAHGGFDPDAFGAACGALRGGGVLLLLTPPLALWPELPDSQNARIAVWPVETDAIGGRFIARLVRQIRADPQALLLTPDNADAALEALAERLRSMPPAEHTEAQSEPPLDRPLSDDQARARDAVLCCARGRAWRPLVVTADRGRGKSAALGLAAGELASAGQGPILVTAPRRSAAAVLLQHAEAIIDARCDAPHRRRQARERIVFYAPAELLDTTIASGLLLVDEAAAIPVPLLVGLLARHPRCVFATTVHGYEGNGRGFAIRFRAHLDATTAGWRQCRLEQPIRWSTGDPLEALVWRALLLNADATAPNEVGSAEQPDRFIELDRDRLARDESLLSALFGLLVLAHYQTRPLDLRMLLDGPNVRVFALMRAGRIAATALLAAEGGHTDTALCTAIHRGERRPRGHLLAQMLTAQGGLTEAPRLRYQRIVRIAVHPALQRQGQGRALVARLRQQLHPEGHDLLGTSFGATPGLISFWQRCGYRPALIGSQRNAASGEHALVMLRALTSAGEQLLRQARQRLHQRLPVWLAGPLRQLDPATVGALLQALGEVIPLAPGLDPDLAENRRELTAFCQAHRPLTATLPLLAALGYRRLGDCDHALAADDAILLVMVALQLQPPKEVVRQMALNGQAELLARLRRIVCRLLEERAAEYQDGS